MMKDNESVCVFTVNKCMRMKFVHMLCVCEGFSACDCSLSACVLNVNKPRC